MYLIKFAITVAGTKQPFSLNQTYNALICYLCHYVIGNVDAIEFHFKKHHKDSNILLNYRQIDCWIQNTHPELRDQALRQTLMLPFLSGSTCGLSGIPKLNGLQCFICEFATIADGSMKNHLSAKHASSTPYAAQKVLLFKLKFSFL